MNAAQHQKYFAEWGRLRAVLRARGLSALACEAERHALTRRALGAVKSSRDFTNAELDHVLARIAAEREPANFAAQWALQDSPDRRRETARAACDRACWEIYERGGNNFLAKKIRRDAYLAALAHRVLKKDLPACTAEDLQVLHGLLARQLHRAQKTPVAAAP